MDFERVDGKVDNIFSAVEGMTPKERQMLKNYKNKVKKAIKKKGPKFTVDSAGNVKKNFKFGGRVNTMKDDEKAKRKSPTTTQSTGAFFSDLIKAIKGGGASKLTKGYKVKKGDTASDIAKKAGITLKQFQKLNPKFRTGQGGTPPQGTVKQKTMQVGSIVKLPDPQSFKNFRLQDIKRKKPVYKGVKEKEFAEMNVPLNENKLGKRNMKVAFKKGGGLIAAIKKVKAKKMEKGGLPTIGEKINFPGMNKDKKKDKNKNKKVPLKFKGFGMLPEYVQEKIDPKLAEKYEKGGVVRGMGKAYQGKPRPVKIR